MISKYNRLKAALAIHDKTVNEFCDEIDVDRHSLRRYYIGERERDNYYLDSKLEELWDSAMTKLEKYEKWKRLNSY